MSRTLHPTTTAAPARTARGDEADPAPTGVTARSRIRGIMLRPEFGVVVAAALIYVFFAAVAGGHGFLTELATAGWITAAAEIGIIALGAGSLMISGE